MKETGHARCPDCGGPLTSASSLARLCPKCLFDLALADPRSGSEAENELPTLAGGASPEPGSVLAERYQIRSVLGRGGQGEVYRAQDLKLRVEVALKALRPELLRNARARELLRSEVRSAREVVSANVCRVFDLVVEEGRELVSMEYIDGTTLAETLKGRGSAPLELSDAQRIASQFLSGLEAIHEAGLVHRDVKPENIMVTASGRVVVMDFGVAKSLAREQERGTIAGTPGYMAPEQARGESVDARADVFSAGVVLAEMTSGALDRSARESLFRSLRESPPKVPESPWAPVVSRALAWDRKARYASARSLARALEEVTLRLPGYEEKSPYPGLASFTEVEAEFFFGRELDVEALWKKLERPRLLALIGPSGAGKSSFLRAGLLTALPEGTSHVWAKPGNRPFHALARALVPHFSGEDDAMERLLRFDDPDTAVPLVKRWRERHERAMVVIDQFEELFTLNPSEVQKSFTTLLGRLAVEADVHVLLSMRDDFLFQCQSYESLSPIFSELTPLGALSESGMRRALIQPALACGYRFEDEGLVDAMVSEVKEERGALPLLAFAASKLWERRDRQRGLLTREAYEHIGGVGGSLAQHAEATLEAVGRERIPIVRELFRNLVTAQGTRAARDREELLGLFEGEEAKAASEVLERLVDARLLTSYEVPGRETESHRIEVIHESLLNAWPRLTHWRAQDREGAQLRDELRQAAQMWEQRDRSDDVLWTGSAFQEFQLWRDRYPGSLTPLEEAFGQAMASRAVRRRRTRQLAVVGIMAALVAVIFVVTSLWRGAVAAQLLALGQVELENYPTAAVGYALKSLETSDSEAARVFALEALQRAPTAIVLPTPFETGESETLAFSPDGEWLAWGGDTEVRVQARSGGPAVLVGDYARAGADWIAVNFDADGGLVSEQGGDLRVWDVEKGIELHREVLEGITDIWTSTAGPGSGFYTASQQGDRRRVRHWREDGSSRALGVFESPGDLDPTGHWWAHRKGRRIFLHPLDDPSEPPRLLAEHSRSLEWVEFHPSGDAVASLDEDGDVLLRDVEPSSTHPRKLRGRGLGALRFSTNGAKLVSSANVAGRPHYRVWDLEGPDAEPIFLVRDVPLRRSTVLDAKGQWLASSHEGDISLWPLDGEYPRVVARDARGPSLGFTSDGRWLLSPTRAGLRAFSMSGTRSTGSRDLWTSKRGPTGSLRTFAIDASGKRVLVSDGNRVHLVPVDDGGVPTFLGELPEVVRAVAISPGGEWAAAAQRWGPAEQKVVWTWNLETLESTRLGPLEGAGSLFEGGVEELRFVDDGRIAVGTWGGLYLVELATGTTKSLARDDAVFYPSIVAGDHGAFILAARTVGGHAHEGELVRYDLADGTQRTLPSHGTRVVTVAIDPTGTLVATGSTDGVIRVGPIDEHEDPHLLLGTEARVTILAFSPDGRYLASNSVDGVVRLWPVPRGRPFHRLPYREVLRRLRSVTNVRVVEDENASTGYSLGLDPFPGWETVPRWWEDEEPSR